MFGSSIGVWFDLQEVKFVSSVVLIASQTQMSDGALNEDRNRAAIAECSRLLMAFITFITDPRVWEERAELANIACLNTKLVTVEPKRCPHTSQVSYASRGASSAFDISKNYLNSTTRTHIGHVNQMRYMYKRLNTHLFPQCLLGSV